MEEIKLVEITASASEKLNLGNFSNKDFFASKKKQVLESEAVMEWRKLAAECEEQVRYQKEEYQKSLYLQQVAKPKPTKPRLTQENKERNEIEEFNDDNEVAPF